MNHIEKSMNEMDLINQFDKEQLKEILNLQISIENYEGAEVVRSAIEQYDDCGPFETYIECGVDMDTEIDGVEFKSN